jgi:glucose-1-phosphatase
MKSLFFDFGNVLAFFDHHKACRQLAGLSNGKFSEYEIYNQVFQTDGLEQQYDRGEISTSEFIDAIKHSFNLSAQPGKIEQAWCDIFSLNDGMIEILKKLKNEQVPLFLASNTNQLHYNWIKTKYANELSVFDDEVISFKIGFRKPERGFFEYCLKIAGMQPSECVFIDDRSDFIDAAREVGLNGLLFTSTIDLEADLEKIAVLYEG